MNDQAKSRIEDGITYGGYWVGGTQFANVSRATNITFET